ncbi:MAG: hypothetical protein A2Z18_06030 [Armatimonadetes bacterium RBG_16_58_9]|nr:MAG: hypothetical protein A2Z18_06030 [Armatimonadetes bacterium RBG_16_58_9]
MNEVVREWIEKAEGDYLTAGREIEITDRPNYDAVCFHAQQCVEKLMKAVLISHGVTPPRTHGLIRLNELVQSARPAWSWPLIDFRVLDRAAVGFRYPGEAADVGEARESLDVATRLREKLLELLSDQQ